MHNFFHPQQTLVQALDNIPHPILVARLQLAGPIFDVEKKWEKQGGKTFKQMLRLKDADFEPVLQSFMDFGKDVIAVTLECFDIGGHLIPAMDLANARLA